MSSLILRLLASEESWSLTIVMTEKLSDLAIISPSSISTVRKVWVKLDLKVKETVYSCVSLNTVGTFGMQFEIH